MIKKADVWKITKLGLASFFALISVLFVVDCIISNTGTEDPNIDSFYYRDGIPVSILLGNKNGDVKLADKQTGYLIKDDSLFLSNPEEINKENLKDNVLLVVDGKTICCPLRWRCWRDDKFQLKEITNNLWLKKTRSYFYYNRIRHHLSGNQYSTILATINDTTYFVENNTLLWRTFNDQGRLGVINIISPVNNQMLKDGKIIFIRTANLVYLSKDAGNHFERIYNGQDCKKESVVWNPLDSSLLMSEYNTEGFRSHLLKYSLPNARIDTLFTFYTDKEHAEKGLLPFCRHIHVMSRDPYTSQIWLGTGDSDSASGIYVTDSSYVLKRIGGGSQKWRTLSFIYKKNNIYWASDCSKPQYLCQANRVAIANGLKEEDVIRYPIFNSAVWCQNTQDDNYGVAIISSNSEGSLFDNYHRVYGVAFDSSGVPTFHDLFNEKSLGHNKQYHQLYPLCRDCEGCYYFYDTYHNILRKFKLERK